MRNPRLSEPPPSKSRPILIVLLLLAVAAGAGLVTWLIVGRTPPPRRTEPPPRPRPPADLIVEPVPEPTKTEDAGAVDADLEGGLADADGPVKRKTGNRIRWGTIDKRRVTAFIKSKQGQVRNCYERRLKANNMLQGVLDAQITLSSVGRVMNVSYNQDTLNDYEVSSCVARVIRTWQFPEPEGGQVIVSNLFRFAPRLDND